MPNFTLVNLPAYLSLVKIKYHGDDGAIINPKVAIDEHAFRFIIDVSPKCDPNKLITIYGCGMPDAPGANANHDISIFLSKLQF